MFYLKLVLFCMRIAFELDVKINVINLANVLGSRANVGEKAKADKSHNTIKAMIVL